MAPFKAATPIVVTARCVAQQRIGYLDSFRIGNFDLIGAYGNFLMIDGRQQIVNSIRKYGNISYGILD
jgi:hypothetical protein